MESRVSDFCTVNSNIASLCRSSSGVDVAASLCDSINRLSRNAFKCDVLCKIIFFGVFEALFPNNYIVVSVSCWSPFGIECSIGTQSISKCILLSVDLAIIRTLLCPPAAECISIFNWVIRLMRFVFIDRSCAFRNVYNKLRCSIRNTLKVFAKYEPLPIRRACHHGNILSKCNLVTILIHLTIAFSDDFSPPEERLFCSLRIIRFIKCVFRILFSNQEQRFVAGNNRTFGIQIGYSKRFEKHGIILHLFTIVKSTCLELFFDSISYAINS